MLNVKIDMFEGKKETWMENLCSPVITVTDPSIPEDKVIIPLAERIPKNEAKEAIRILEKIIKEDHKTLEEVRKTFFDE